MQRNAGFLYGSGYLGIALITYVIGAWITYFYAPPPHSGLWQFMPPAWAGLAFAIGRIVDAVADPLVGVWSDRHRGKRGRRIPFLRASAVPLALSFAILWLPPRGASPIAAFIYLTLTLGAFFTLYTVYVAPYLALLPQLSRSEADRLNLSVWQGIFNVVGIAIGALAAGMIASALGFGWMGVILGAITLVSLVIPAWMVREPASTEAEIADMGVVPSIRSTLANRPFRTYVAGQFCFWFGLNAVLINAPYLVTVVAGKGEVEASIALGVAILASVAAFPVFVRIAKRYGLRQSLIVSMIWFAVVLFLAGLVGRPFMPFTAYTQVLLVNFLAGVPIAALLVLPNPLMAEITDYDERATGKRREAIYFGVQGLIVKASMALSSVLATQMLSRLGYTPDAPWGVLAIGPMAGLFVLLGITIFRRYPRSVPGN